MEQAEFKGRVAIVTGSATGIGAATARALARGGAHVVVNYSRNETAARATAQAVEELGAQVRLVKGDVARDEDCRALARAAMEAWSRIDILVNNAGTTKFVAHNNLDGLSAEDFARIYAVNTIGAFQMVRACAPQLRAHGDGSIVNVSSIAAVTGIGSSVAYAASKGALSTLTLSLARALAPHIRVNAVCPGYVATPWHENHLGQDAFKRMTEEQVLKTPLRRSVDVDEVAKSILFFASSDSAHITGEQLLIDGGRHLGV